MSKLSKIKAELAKMLLKFESVKTDNGVLEYEGEIKEGTKVFITDAETEERTPAADGEYVMEDGRTLVVADGAITEIKEAVEEETEPETTEETPAEETTEEVAAEDETEPETTEETPAEEVTEEVVIEVVEETVDEVAELKGRIDALEALVKELAEKVVAQAKDTEEKFSKISLAKPAVEEFEQARTVRKTGEKSVDRFMERYGNI